MYADFEARIPEGQYGAGDMILWDAGTYETVPPGQEEKMRAKGHLHVRFFGEKLRGGWHFVRTKGTAPQGGRHGGESAKAQWLMFKADDETADPARDILTERPESVKSGKSATRGPRRVGASPEGKTALALVAAVGEIARATLVSAVDDVTAYWYEIKYDGYRLLAAKAGDEVRLVTRGGHDWTTKFPIVADAVRKLPVREAVIDGEACVVDDAGRPSFQALQAWLAGETKDAKLGYVTFDLLWVDGRDLRTAPIEERRELLLAIVAKAPAPLSFSRASAAANRAELARIVEAARGAGLEGIVAKRRGSRYVGGTGGAWRKLKFERRQDCVVVGWVPMAGASRDLGALLLAVKDGGALRYAGRVGTGFDERTRRAILAELGPLTIDAAPVVVSKKDAARATWVTPALVCEVAFGEWTNDGHMRRFELHRPAKGQDPRRMRDRLRGRAPDPDPDLDPDLDLDPDPHLRPDRDHLHPPQAPPPHQPHQAPLPPRQPHQARHPRLLPRHRAASPPAPRAPPPHPPALAGRHRRRGLVPAKRPLPSPAVRARRHLREEEARRLRQRRDARVAGEPRGAHAAPVVVARTEAREARLRRPGPRPRGSDDMEGRHRRRPRGTDAARRAVAGERGEDERQARDPCVRAHRRRAEPRRGDRVRRADCAGGGEGDAERRDHRADQGEAEGAPLHRLPAERRGEDDRRPLHDSSARRRARVHAARLERGERAARSARVHGANRARACREARGPVRHRAPGRGAFCRIRKVASASATRTGRDSRFTDGAPNTTLRAP